MSKMTTRLYTALFGRQVGTDALGNRYFQGRGKRGKRWVMFAGAAEPSSVTPDWHRWLHRATDITPADAPIAHRAWVKPPRANPTGTSAAYLPPGHLLKAARHAPTTAEYEPWVPHA